MRTRLIAAVTAALFVVPIAAASATTVAPQPQHDCRVSGDTIRHHCK